LGKWNSIFQALFLLVHLEGFSPRNNISLNFFPKPLQLSKDFVVNNLKEKQIRILHLAHDRGIY
jgi:hypothetical protein